MLNITSASLEIGLPSDTKDLESAFNNIPTLSKKDFSQVFERQISADGEGDVTKKTDNILNQSHFNEKDTNNESLSALAQDNVEIILDDSPEKVKLPESKGVEGVTDDYVDLNNDDDEFLAVKDTEVINNTEQKPSKDQSNFSVEFIHLLSASEKLLPQNDNVTIVANTLNDEEVDVTKPSEYEITDADVLFANSEAVPLTLFKQNNNQVINTIQVPQSAETLLSEASLILDKGKIANDISEVANDELKGEVTLESVITPLPKSINFTNIKADSVDNSELINNENTIEKLQKTNAAIEPEKIVLQATGKLQNPDTLQVASTVTSPDTLQVASTVTSPDTLQVASTVTSPDTLQATSTLTSSDTLQATSTLTSSDTLQVASTLQTPSTLQPSVKNIIFDEANLKPIVVDTIDIDESTLKNDIKSTLFDNELRQNIKPNVLNETKLDVNDVADNRIEKNILSTNSIENIKGQLDSVSQTIITAENHQETAKKNTLLNENAEQYKFSGTTKESKTEQPSTLPKESEALVSKGTSLENNINENVTIKNTVSQVLTSQINDSIIHNESDTRYNDISTNAQSVDGFSNRFVAESVQQNKLNVNQQVETININDKNFSESVKEKVLFAISQKLQQIDIQLDPPELGNVHVRVNLQNEVAAVNFVVQQQQTKESLEQHMDKLKDMLADSGVNLGEANVEQQNQGEKGSEEGAHNNSNGSDVTLTENNVITGQLTKDSTDGVDFYA